MQKPAGSEGPRWARAHGCVPVWTSRGGGPAVGPNENDTAELRWSHDEMQRLNTRQQWRQDNNQEASDWTEPVARTPSSRCIQKTTGETKGVVRHKVVEASPDHKRNEPHVLSPKAIVPLPREATVLHTSGWR